MKQFIKDEGSCVSLYNKFTVGIRPAIAHGSWGIIKEDKEYIIFAEDDDHFWNVLTLNEEQYQDLKNAMISLHKEMSTKKHNLFKYRFRGATPIIKSPHFGLHYHVANTIIDHIILKISGEKIIIFPYDLDGLVKCLQFK